MLNKYRLFQRANGVFYWQDNESGKQGSLRTKDRRAAEKLLHAKNEAHRLPTLNLTMARAYLSAHDAKMSTRTWMAVMREMGTHGIASSQERCARVFCSKAFDSIRHKPLVQTTAEDLLSIVHNNGHSVAHYLRRLHNLACDLGWLAWPILAKRVWPKIRSKHRRAVTAEEHAEIIASEKNPEKRAYYEFLYETGAAQSDAAELTAENIDWQDGLLVYHRKKLGLGERTCAAEHRPETQGASRVAAKIRRSLSNDQDGGANARSTEFRRRCRIAGVSGVSLHSYRHSWAQRAKACGYPQRFAQDALGHSSRAVHEAYAKGAFVIVPPLDEYESIAQRKVIAMPLRISLNEAQKQTAS